MNVYAFKHFNCKATSENPQSLQLQLFVMTVEGPARTGTSAFSANARAVCLRENMRIVSAVGPRNAIPAACIHLSSTLNK